MTMLSGPSHRPRSDARSAGSQAPKRLVCVPQGTGVAFELCGVQVLALADGALFLPQARTLIVSDLHLEKGSAFARRGQLLPPYDSRATLTRLAAQVAAFEPLQIVALGDSFHDREAASRLDPIDAAHVRALTGLCAWIWIRGNHDPEPPEALGGESAETVAIGPLTLRHEPELGPARGEICGHLHPCAVVAGRGRRLRTRCFATDGERLVMPAYGAYTGGLNVRDRAFEPLFPQGATALLAARGRVSPAAWARLHPDGG